jgi:hypothetical protein
MSVESNSKIHAVRPARILYTFLLMNKKNDEVELIKEEMFLINQEYTNSVWVFEITYDLQIY